MRLLRYGLLVFLLTLVCGSVFGQIRQPCRFETELDYYDDYFTVIPAEEKGIALVRETSEKGKDGDMVWELVKLDTSLNREWQKQFPVAYRWFFKGYDYHNNSIILLFNDRFYNKDDLLIYQIDLDRGELKKLTIKLDFTIELSHFEMVGSSAIFGGYVNYRPTVFLYNLEEERIMVLPGFYVERSELIQVEVDDDREIFHVLATMRTFDRKMSIAMKTFDKDGDMLINTVLKPEEDRHLLYGRAITTNYGEQFITGTFSGSKSSRQGKESYSMGIFIARINPWGEQNINYYNYADLDNFFNYMKANRQKRIQKRIERKRIKGKKIKFNYRLLVHEIIQRDNGNYLMLGEAYYPTTISRSETGSFAPFSSQYYPMAYKGFQYTHAVVVGFNSTGERIWDNSFEINDVKSYHLEKFVNADIREDKIILLYNYDNVIRTKIIKGDEVLEGKTFNDIALKFEDDEAENNGSMVGGLDSWYDNYFYAYGIQTIKNDSDAVKRKREVFFVNKIYYE